MRGLTRRCPWCGDRHAYFAGGSSASNDAACGHGYRRGDHAFELGAITANIILTFVVLLTIVLSVVVTLPDVSVGGRRVGGDGGALGPALLYPVSFTLWQAIDLWMRPPTAGELAGGRRGLGLIHRRCFAMLAERLFDNYSGVISAAGGGLCDTPSVRWPLAPNNGRSGSTPQRALSRTGDNI